MILIETERLALRSWKAMDREPFARLNADPRVMEYQPGVLTSQESDRFADYVEAHFAEHGFTLYAAELRAQQRFIGFIGIHVPRFQAAFTPCIEIGWRLAADVWGRGLATEGALAVIRYSFEVLGLLELVSFTALINTRSQRVMQKIGMIYDRREDFDHPNLPEGHPLRRHILYRIANPGGERRRATA